MCRRGILSFDTPCGVLPSGTLEEREKAVICPICGTLVVDEAEVCPACHHRLKTAPVVGDDEARWCASCGSPIPTGLNTCPECGMPVEGAFDEGLGERFSVGKVVEVEKPEALGFKSAVPPAPQNGGEAVSSAERPRHTRLVLLAAIAALVLVGGTTLLIVQPWNPNAYATHALVDADTSMEGFPGEWPYLSSQDRVEEGEYQAQLDAAVQQVNSMQSRLGELAATLESSYQSLKAYIERGYVMGDDGTRVSEMTTVQKELEGYATTLNEISFSKESEFMKQRDDLLVLVGYMRGATDVLVEAWSTAIRENGSPDVVFNVRSIVKGDHSDHGFKEWFELFSNAYAAKA